jgi:acyl-coenzyme A thioesterase PaaI-like protein
MGTSKGGRKELTESLQERFAPNGVCFGCGPKNPRGLHLKSVPSGERVTAEFTPEPYHASFGEFGSGGIISVLLDCHGNWAAAFALMKARGLSSPPGTVTAEYTVRFLKPSPVRKKWVLNARATKIEGDRVYVAGELAVEGAVTSTMTGLFVAVKEDHPAFHRWR